MEPNDAIFATFMDNQEFRNLVEMHLRRDLSEKIREELAGQAKSGAA